MNYDIYLVGVGGQGVLTIADLITESAFQAGIPANYFPVKGMAQRGGFVKAELRLGRESVGPHIPEKGADLAIAMELSEALKAVRYVKPGGHFLLFGKIWQPTAVMLGKAVYPELEQVKEQIEDAGALAQVLDPKQVPQHKGRQVPANVYVLGAAIGRTPLGEFLNPDTVKRMIETRWNRGVEGNRLAFTAGMESA